MSRKTEIQVGATVVVALVILIAGTAWLKDSLMSQGKVVWKVEFPQTGGLSASDEVLVNGIRKGQVSSMALEGDKVMVELELADDVVLTRDSKVAIRNVGLMGERVIAVDLKATGAPYDRDETIPGVYEQGLGEVMGQLGGAIEAVGELSVELQRVASMLGRDGRLERTIENFDQTSEALRLVVSENRAALRDAVQNFSDASGTAKRLTSDREDQLRQALDNFSSAAEKMDHLSGRLDSLRSVIQGMTARVERGEGTLGKLVNDEQLYAELNESIQSFKALVEDIKAHPKRYLKFSLF